MAINYLGKIKIIGTVLYQNDLNFLYCNQIKPLIIDFQCLIYYKIESLLEIIKYDIAVFDFQLQLLFNSSAIIAVN